MGLCITRCKGKERQGLPVNNLIVFNEYTVFIDSKNCAE